MVFLVIGILQLISRKSFTPTDWAHVDVESMTSQQIMDYLYWTNRSSCRLVNYFGGIVYGWGVDGQKAVCMDPEVRPSYENCLAYSFGINYEWSFEDMLCQYGCEIFAFDPTMLDNDHDHIKDKVHFFKLGLGSSSELVDNLWQIHSLTTLYSDMIKQGRHKPDRIIDYLKIDIEGMEWKAIPQFFQSGILKKVRQLAMEIHLPEEGTIDDVRQVVKLLKKMEDEHGMIRFDSQPNPSSEYELQPLGLYGCNAFEIAWYNINLKRDKHNYKDNT